MNLIEHWSRLQPESNNASLLYYSGLGLSLPQNFDPLSNQSVATLRSHYALVYKDAENIHLVTDQMRSFPLFYTISDNDIVVSDDPYFVAEYVQNRVSPVTYQQVAAMGFTCPDQTFYEGVYQVMPGTCTSVCLANGQVTHRVIHRPFFTEVATSATEEQFLTSLEKSFDTVMRRAVDACKDAQILVPLSGGLDSRLIVTWLARHKIKNVVCFTYGRSDSSEMEVSRQIAENLGLTWVGVELHDEQVTAAWKDPETADFLRYCASGSALPHIQDWYALRYLRDNNLARPGDVVFPGHTIVDNFHNHELRQQLPIDRRHLINVIVKKHCVMRPQFSTEAGEASLCRFIAKTITNLHYDDTERLLQRSVEALNFLLRQTMYINNSVRAYEFFGLRWAIPMLDREFTDTWCAAPVDFTIERGAYSKWIQGAYQAETGILPDLYGGPATKIPTFLIDGIRTIGKRTGILKLANRIYATKVSLHHPMGFDLYFGTSTSVSRIIRLLSGGNATALWTAEFLNDKWHPDLRMFNIERH